MAEKDTNPIVNSLQSELATLLIIDPKNKRIAEIRNLLKQMSTNPVQIIAEPTLDPTRGMGNKGKKTTPTAESGDENR